MNAGAESGRDLAQFPREYLERSSRLEQTSTCPGPVDSNQAG